MAYPTSLLLSLLLGWSLVPAPVAPIYPSTIIAHGEGDAASTADSLFSICTSGINVETNRLATQRALTACDRLLAAYQSSGNAVEAANISLTIGSIHEKLGDFAEAIAAYDRARATFQAASQPEKLAECFTLLGYLYEKLGLYPQATDFHRAALDIYLTLRGTAPTSMGNVYATSQRINLGNLYLKMGRYAEAQQSFREAIERLDQGYGNSSDLPSALMGLGSLAHLQNDLITARDYYQQAYAQSEWKIGSDLALGMVEYSAGNYHQSLRHYQVPLETMQELGRHFDTGMIQVMMSLNYLYLQDFATAEDLLKSAIGNLSRLRENLADTQKVAIFEVQKLAYQYLQVALVQQNRSLEALEAAESGRSRALVDFISLSDLEMARDTVLSDSLNLNSIQRVARDNQTTIVEYSLIPSLQKSPLDLGLVQAATGVNAYDALMIWVVTPSGDIHFRTVDLKAQDVVLSDLVSLARRDLGTRSPRGFVIDEPIELGTFNLQRLHHLLIDPIADLLPTDSTQKVVFIPQNELFLVPFAALLDDSGTYLVERYTLLTAPSIQVLQLSQQRRHAQAFHPTITNQEVLIVGNPTMPAVWHPSTSAKEPLPPLPGAEREARVIADFFQTTPLVGDGATEAAIKARIGGARFVHLATHGLLEYGNPRDTGIRDTPGAIALAPGYGEDGLLTAAEILTELNLGAELVVLSACDTGLGTITGDGVVGLSRSLIAAGTPSVVVSLWAVPDAPTAELMTEFYRQMQQGQDKAQALRQAMLETMKTNPDPSDWAAFTLIGAAE